MTPWELGLAALLYANIARRYMGVEDYGHALAWGAYALANGFHPGCCAVARRRASSASNASIALLGCMPEACCSA